MMVFENEKNIKYTEVEQNTMDNKARSTKEMNDHATRPEIDENRDNRKD